jgi:hypothetical protein
VSAAGRAEAVSTVMNRLDDLGLTEMSRIIGGCPAIHRLRLLVLESRNAAHAIHSSALHFDAKPIAESAMGLLDASVHALTVIDVELEAIFIANQQPSHERGGMQPHKARPRLNGEDR